MPYRNTVLSLLAVTLIPIAAHGQEPRRDSVPEFELEPLIVTVMRLPLPYLSVPHALAVGADSSVIRARPRLALSELFTGVPGVIIQDRYNSALGDRITIRGFGARTQFGIRGVRVLVDGIPATLADGQTTLDHLDLGTVNKVEVVRGPSSSIYGNASGGVLHFETGRTTAAAFDQELGFIAGSDGLVRVEASTASRTGPTTFGFDFTRFLYNGYREHSEADKYLTTWHLRFRDSKNDLRLVANFADFDALNPGSLNDSMLRADRDAANPFNVSRQTGKNARQGQLGVSWTRQLPNVRLAVSGYGLLRDLSNPIPVRIIEIDRMAGGARVAVEGEAAGTDWTVGADIDVQSDDRRNFENSDGAKGLLTLDQSERVWSIGPFLEISVELTPALYLLGGIRYDRIHFSADDRFTSGDPDDSGERTMDAVSPSFGVLLQVAEPAAVYANIATSFETPTTTELVNQPSGAGGFNRELEPQRTISIEGGIKGRAGSMVEYQFAAYRARVTDELIPFEVEAVPGRSFFRNSGTAIHSGVELGAALRPRRGALFRMAYTYTNARFDEYATADETFDGNKVPGVAPHRLELFGSYDTPLGWYVAVEAEYQNEMAVNDANTALSPDYVVVDVRAGSRGLETGAISLAPFAGVFNLFDEEYNSAVTVNAFGGRFFEPGPPRSFYFGARLRFGVYDKR